LDNPTVRRIAHVTGLIVSAFPALRICLQGHYRSIEICKSKAISSGLDYDDHAILDEHAKADLLWISDNITSFNGKPILDPDTNVYIESDASLTGWGATCLNQNGGGYWTPTENLYHINYLELLAVFLPSSPLFPIENPFHVRIQLDISTAVSDINNIGGMKSPSLYSLAKEMWSWCINRDIWLSAQHIPG